VKPHSTTLHTLKSLLDYIRILHTRQHRRQQEQTRELIRQMLKYFFGHHEELPYPPRPPTPPAPQTRQSRLGKPYQAPKKPENVMPENKVVHAKLPPSNPSLDKVSRLGKHYDTTPRKPPPPSSYHEVESSENPIVSFMLACVTCDDATMEQSGPVVTATKEME
jgi:hypothetical protein